MRYFTPVLVFVLMSMCGGFAVAARNAFPDLVDILPGARSENETLHLPARFRPELRDAQLLTQAIWACMHGLVALHLTKEDDDWVDWRPPQKTSEVLADMVMRTYHEAQNKPIYVIREEL